MSQSPTIEELRNIIALRDIPEEHLQWILSHSEYYEFEDGDIIFKKGDPIDVMWLLLEGKVHFYLDINGRLVYYFTFENDNISGGLGGLLPYSRMKKTPGSSYAAGKIRMLTLHKKFFQELEQLNPDLIQRLIGYMTERARIFATTQMQHEKVSALGNLAAGIAHELNNPASAINRISTELDKKLKINFELTEKLLNNNISSEVIKNIHETIRNNETKNSAKIKITPLQRIEKEDEINEWLNKNGFNGNNNAAETFIEAGFSIDDLEKFHRNMDNESFSNVIDWLENLLSSELLVRDLEDASGRITKLVGAIKTHVHMDRSNDFHFTDIHKDIENTLTLLGYKIREKKISVKKNFCEDMPEVEAYVGELNQVWTNIIDNAVYALPQNGELQIETICDKKTVTVRITDNGAGIPKEILSRIFDPFFTTKKVGEGTGIGLDIVHRVIKQHKGEVKVNSVPGKTEFIIILPIIQQKKQLKNETSIHNNY